MHDRAGWADNGALRISAAKIAFKYLAASNVVRIAPKRAVLNAHLTLDAFKLIDEPRSCFLVLGDSACRTDRQAARFFALKTHDGDGMGAVPNPHLGASAVRVEFLFMKQGASQFAGMAIGAVFRCDD